MNKFTRIEALPLAPLGKSLRQIESEKTVEPPAPRRLHDDIFIDFMGRYLNLPARPTTPRTKEEAEKLAKEQVAKNAQEVAKAFVHLADKLPGWKEVTAADREPKAGDVWQYRDVRDVSEPYRNVYRVLAADPHDGRRYANVGWRLKFTNGNQNYSDVMRLVLAVEDKDGWIPFTVTKDSTCPKGIEDWQVEVRLRTGEQLTAAAAVRWTWSECGGRSIVGWRPKRT